MLSQASSSVEAQRAIPSSTVYPGKQSSHHDVVAFTRAFWGGNGVVTWEGCLWLLLGDYHGTARAVFTVSGSGLFGVLCSQQILILYRPFYSCILLFSTNDYLLNEDKIDPDRSNEYYPTSLIPCSTLSPRDRMGWNETTSLWVYVYFSSFFKQHRYYSPYLYLS